MFSLTSTAAVRVVIIPLIGLYYVSNIFIEKLVTWGCWVAFRLDTVYLRKSTTISSLSDEATAFVPGAILAQTD